MSGVNTKERVMQAAVEALMLDPYAQTREIAERARITKSVIYHYFATKEQMFRQAFDYFHTLAGAGLSFGLDLTAWIFIRFDAVLAARVREVRQAEREEYGKTFGRPDFAWLLQAALVGLASQRSLGAITEDEENEAVALLIRMRDLSREKYEQRSGA